MAKHNEIGKLGEKIATKYLLNKGYKLIDRNFFIKMGEIDIIMTKNGFNFHMKTGDLIFIEVKTKSILDFKNIKDINNDFKPENNLTFSKRQNILKSIRHFLSFIKTSEADIDIKIMAVMVYLNTNTKQAKIKIYNDFIL